MKKIIPLFLVMVMIFGMLSGCGSSSDTATPVGSTENTTSNENVIVDNTSPNSNNGIQEGEGTIGNYYVKFISGEMITDFEGKPAFLVRYEFTNNSENTIAPWAAISITAFQDGISLDSCYAGDGYNLENEDKEIRPGTTISVSKSFVTTSNTSPIELEAVEWTSFVDTGKVITTYTFEN